MHWDWSCCRAVKGQVFSSLRAADLTLTVFQQLHELVWSELQFAQVLAQHGLAQGVSGVGSLNATTFGVRLGLRNDRAEPAFPFCGA